MHPFFPGPATAWAFLLVLSGLLAIATWHDFRAYVIPKRVSLLILAVGVVANLVRGAWLGSQGHPAWLFGSGVVGGVADGLLFSAAGTAVGFGLFFVMWVLGLCGGGDVKLAAGVGAWVGPGTFVVCLVLSVVFVIILGLGRAVVRGIRRGQMTADRSPQDRLRARLLGYSLPLTLGTILTLLVGMPHEFGLLPRPAPPAAVEP